MVGNVLEGVRVVDWTIAHAGPKGTVFLAVLGAEVIHSERPGEGLGPGGVGGMPGLRRAHQILNQAG